VRRAPVLSPFPPRSRTCRGKEVAWAFFLFFFFPPFFCSPPAHEWIPFCEAAFTLLSFFCFIQKSNFPPLPPPPPVSPPLLELEAINYLFVAERWISLFFFSFRKEEGFFFPFPPFFPPLVLRGQLESIEGIPPQPPAIKEELSPFFSPFPPI